MDVHKKSNQYIFKVEMKQPLDVLNLYSNKKTFIFKLNKNCGNKKTTNQTWRCSYKICNPYCFRLLSHYTDQVFNYINDF